jgi:hypothetical protein
VRKLFLLSLACLVLNVLLLASLYIPNLPGGALAPAAGVLSFVLGALSFAPALYITNNRQLGRLSLPRFWGALLAMPRWVQIGLGLIFVVTIVQSPLNRPGPQTESGFFRGYIATGVWLCVVGTALIYTALRQQQRGEPPAEVQPSIVVKAVFIAIGLALAASAFLSNRDPIFDEAATHDRLTAEFGGSTWYPHLVAANTYHGAFIVYLDTKDAAVQSAACDDLKPVATERDRTPDLYFASGGHGTFVRTC